MIRRRELLGLLGSLGALPIAACRRRQSASPSCAVTPRQEGPGKVLDADQWSSLRAACARLIPSEPGPRGAGATEANVVGFIDEQLTMPPVRSFRAELLEGLRQMDLLSQRLAGAPFAALPADKQDQVLGRLQRGVPLGRRRDSRHFFLVLLTLSLEGFLCDPVYGGNRDEAGWRTIGFKPRPPRPRCPYRAA